MQTSNKSRYDNLFKHNIDNYVKNIIVYSKKDKWSINQEYNKIDNQEHTIWNDLFNKVYSIAYDNSNNMFRTGLEFLSNNLKDFNSKIPNLDNTSDLIKSQTGWQIKTVSGFVDEVIFFELLANKCFPSSDIIRLSKRFYNKYKNTNVKNVLDYTPEPDIFHEIFGHAPFLLNNDYSLLLQKIGKLGCSILYSKDLTKDLIIHNLKRLQNFVWWTLEFGLLKSNNSLGYEIYGAGILSSYDEITHVLSSEGSIREYDFEEIIMTRFDYSDLQDRYYLIESFNTLLKDFDDYQEHFFYKG